MSVHVQQPIIASLIFQALWKYKLQYKFRNARKREDSAIPNVVSRKRKSPSMQNLNQSAVKTAPPQWGIVNYLPPRPESEDDASIEQHISWMKLEKLKKKPHYERIGESMSATLADRRKLIIKDGASVKDIKETYPWLFEEDEVGMYLGMYVKY